MNQKKVEIADKMYRARNAVVDLMGEEKFKERVDGFRPILQSICDTNNISQMQATIQILQELEDKGVEKLLATAACVEIMEPRQCSHESTVL